MLELDLNAQSMPCLQEATLAGLQSALQSDLDPALWTQTASKVAASSKQKLVRAAGLQPVVDRLVASANTTMKKALEGGVQKDIRDLISSMTQLHALVQGDDARTILMQCLNFGSQDACHVE